MPCAPLSSRDAERISRFFRQRLTYPIGNVEGVEEDKQEEAKRIAQNFKIIKQAKERDPYFIKRVFVSHYCNIPYHLMLDGDLYPMTLLEELFAASYYLIRNFELAPWATGNLEDRVEKLVEDGRV